jgi:hypothetical protein
MNKTTVHVFIWWQTFNEILISWVDILHENWYSTNNNLFTVHWTHLLTYIEIESLCYLVYRILFPRCSVINKKTKYDWSNLTNISLDFCTLIKFFFTDWHGRIRIVSLCWWHYLQWSGTCSWTHQWCTVEDVLRDQ